MKKFLIGLFVLILITGVVGCGTTRVSSSYGTAQIASPSVSATSFTSSTNEKINYVPLDVSPANCQIVKQLYGVVHFKPQYCALNCDYVQLNYTEFPDDLNENKSLSFIALIYWSGYPVQGCGNFLEAIVTSKDKRMATVTIRSKGSMFSEFAQAYDLLYLTFIAEQENIQSTTVSNAVPSSSANSGQGVTTESDVSFAEPMVDNMLAGIKDKNYSQFSHDFTDKMKSVMTEDKFGSLVAMLESKIGDYESKTSGQAANTSHNGEELIVITYTAKYTKESGDVIITVSFSDNYGTKQIAGLNFNSHNLRQQ